MDLRVGVSTAAVFLVSAGAAIAVALLLRTRRHLRSAESSDRSRRLLLADVSHELMAPLTAIRGYIETLQLQELDLDEPTRRRYLAIVEGECDRLEHLLADLRELARTEAGGGRCSPGLVATTELFERIKRRHERELQERHVRLDIEVDSRAEEIWADVLRLEQAIENLVTNAIRHTHERGRISMRAVKDDEGARIQVTDDGGGIAPEHLPFIFERFYTFSTGSTGATSRPSGGSGLGLSIVKAIAERHGGRAGVTSRPGETVFEIVIPHPRPSGPLRRS